MQGDRERGCAPAVLMLCGEYDFRCGPPHARPVSTSRHTNIETSIAGDIVARARAITGTPRRASKFKARSSHAPTKPQVNSISEPAERSNALENTPYHVMRTFVTGRPTR